MTKRTVLPDGGYVTPHWLQRYLDISNSTMYLWVKQGLLPPLHHIGPRAVRFRVEDIRSFEAKVCGGEQ